MVFEKMEEYIWQSQNTVTHYITTQSLLHLCEGTEQTTGARGGGAVVGSGGKIPCRGKGYRGGGGG